MNHRYKSRDLGVDVEVLLSFFLRTLWYNVSGRRDEEWCNVSEIGQTGTDKTH